MKQINWENLSRRNDYSIDQFIERGVGMEFIKYGDKYLVKGSNGYIVDEKEKLQIEKGELVLKDIEGCNCQKDTTLKIREINKQLEEIEKKEKPKRKKVK
jgi:hypothetical protein